MQSPCMDSRSQNSSVEHSLVAKPQVPKISVVIPAYNNADYITTALQSITVQEYPNVEIIVVDDGSTDETKQRVEDYGQDVVLISQANAGPAAARNTGLEVATGEFVAFLDADDWFLPSKFRKQSAALADNPWLGASHSGWTIVDDTGRMLDHAEPWQTAPKLNLATWINHQPVRLGAMLFRRKWLTRVGGFDPAMRQAEDTDLLLRLAIDGCRFEWLKESTHCYRHHGDSLVRSRAIEQVEYGQRVVDKFFSNPKISPSVKKWEPYVRYYTTTWLAWHLFQTGHSELTVALLAKAARVSRFDAKHTLEDWTAQYSSWHLAEGKDTDEVRTMWPYFCKAAHVSEIEWQQIQPSLEWCLDVWQHYSHGNYEVGATQLRANQQIGSSGSRTYAKELAERIHFYVMFTPNSRGLEAIEQLWHDAKKFGFVTSGDRYHLTGLYLGLVGQSLWHNNPRTAVVAMSRAVRAGATLKAWPAWRKSLQLGLNYLSGTTSINEERDVVLPLEPVEPKSKKPKATLHPESQRRVA